GAMVISADDDLSALVINPETDSEVIIYCACPNEVSAAQLARRLMQRGYTRVRPLTGGIDAWVAAGYTLEQNCCWRYPPDVTCLCGDGDDRTVPDNTG